MTYPPQGPQYPQQGQPQPGYGQQPPQNYPPQQGPPAGYAQPQQGYDQQGPFNFADVYNQADATSGMLDEGTYPSLVDKSEFGRTSKGDKWAWTIAFRLSTGQYTGRQLTMTLSLSPKTNEGKDNSFGMGKTFRQLSALGVPVGDKFGGQPGEQPWFAQFPVPQGASIEQQNAAIKAAGDYAAQLMTGRPVRIRVIQDQEWGNNKIRDIFPAAPGDPVVMPQSQQGGPAQAPGYQPQGMPTQPYQQQPYQPQAAPYAAPPQPGPQPVGPPAQPPWGQGGQAPPQYAQGGPIANMPQQFADRGQALAAGAQAAMQPGPQAPQPYQGQAPAPAQQPGPGGLGQFTPPEQQGQPAPAPQAPAQPPWQPNGAPQQPQAQPPPGQGQIPVVPPGQAPPPPPWAQPQQ